MDDSIILGCPTCRMVFFIDAFTTDPEGNTPNPLFCPFCAAPDLVDGFDMPEMEEDKPLPDNVVAITVLSGGKAHGGQDGEKEGRSTNTRNRK